MQYDQFIWRGIQKSEVVSEFLQLIYKLATIVYLNMHNWLYLCLHSNHWEVPAPLFYDVILKSNSEMLACRSFSLFCRCFRVVTWRFNVCLCFSSSWMESLCPSLICWWVSNVTSCAISGHSTVLVCHAVFWEANLLLIYCRIGGNNMLNFLWPKSTGSIRVVKP